MAGTYSTTIITGETFGRVITWQDSSGSPYDLTGFSARMQLRTKSGGTLVKELNTTSGGIVLGGSAGTITVSISAADTAALTPQDMVYDLFVTSGSGIVTRLLVGSIPVVKSVTQ